MQSFNKKNIILGLCAACVIGVLPFIVLRLMDRLWLMVAVDSTALVGAALIGLYVIKSNKLRLASVILTALFLVTVVLVVNIKGPSLIYWLYPTMITGYFLLKPGEALIVNILALFAIFPIINTQLVLIEQLSILFTITLVNVFSYIVFRSMAGHQDVLTQQATQDGLTGAGNRRLFDYHMEPFFASATEQHTPLSLIVLDIDNFKAINDTFGHVKGDEVLCAVLKLLSSRLRKFDTIYRLGGDEFAIVLSEASCDAAVSKAEELCHLVNSDPFCSDIKMTVSFGVAERHAGDEIQELVARADSALYRAKEEGRNRVCGEWVVPAK
ncbi:GGDEF domain-containing protein [Amphritea pacifica]|uniref:GGDEF domain-containing protein n=1 Tax=Amphritea pacifica TaxID=2811233 RepID=UPI0019641C50|nr:GGDEF domain-containing protein [Amphritea pacifica]MBN1007143.1 GGDEF domain-containing protein [Amphritea pacifica]